MKTLRNLATVAALALAGAIAHAQSAPMVVHYQGRLTQPNGLPLTTPIASVAFEIFPSASGGTRLWPPAGPLSTYTVILRNGGIFSVMLGDTSIPGMPALTQSVFQQGVVYLQISIAGNPVGPRQPIVSVPWSILSQQANLAVNVVDGAITTAKLANDAVTTAKLANDAVTTAKLANGAVTEVRLADGSVSTPKLANDAVTATKLASNSASLSKVTGGRASMNSNGISLTGGGSGAWFEAAGNSTGVFFNRNGNGGNAFELAQTPSYGDNYDLKLRRYKNGGDQGVALVVSNATGNIGIGTSDPATHLEVSSASPATFLRVNRPGGAQLDLYASDSDGFIGTRTNHPFNLGSNFNTRMTIQPDGRVVFGNGVRLGIGTDAPIHALTVNGDAYFTGGIIQGTTYSLNSYPTELVINQIGTGRQVRVVGNNFRVEDNTPENPSGGQWTPYISDRRVKKNIGEIQSPLDTLLRFHGVMFEYRDPSKWGVRPGQQMGFIAQDVGAVFPDWLIPRGDGYYTYSLPAGFEALTVEAIREQQKQIDALTKHQEALTRENERLRRQNAGFEARLRALESKAAR